MFFVLGKPDPEHFLLVNATSRVEKARDQLDRIFKPFDCSASDVSVTLEAKSHPFLTKKTLIDCSQPHRLSLEELINGAHFELLENAPDLEFFIPLLTAWAASPLTNEADLTSLRPQWKEHGILF
ncbi:hypothetical protein C1Y63_08430 [Corynebacterium sp. 13CS0277]|uniref:hypothetical protein n=1 Tax=Corynebacterium sp. 13CS0277 TaxID=2071994 RepID=UPI000D482658|nr:hypothetical protein [Corynebacterium sp. 13CS0277]PRQ11012.1 hypothetical protein C1Y63_08430 [Corynebacterium sp. 13CS0277]